MNFIGLPQFKISAAIEKKTSTAFLFDLTLNFGAVDDQI